MNKIITFDINIEVCWLYAKYREDNTFYIYYWLFDYCLSPIQNMKGVTNIVIYDKLKVKVYHRRTQCPYFCRKVWFIYFFSWQFLLTLCVSLCSWLLQQNKMHKIRRVICLREAIWIILRLLSSCSQALAKIFMCMVVSWCWSSS